MTPYLFRCESCGPFEQRMAMGTAGQACRCRKCGGLAIRQFQVHRLAPATPLSRALAREEACREVPEVKVLGGVGGGRC